MTPIETTIDDGDESPDAPSLAALVTTELVSERVVEAEEVKREPRWKRALGSIGRGSLLLFLALMTFGFLCSGLSPEPSALVDKNGDQSTVAAGGNGDGIETESVAIGLDNN